MGTLIIEQLTIFETINTFDEGQAIWKGNRNKYCMIRGYVPERILSPKELENLQSCKSKKKEFYYELWEHHVFAIWSYQNKKMEINWNSAERLLNKHRDNRTAIEMKIPYELRDWFTATQVDEYLF